MHRAAVKLRPEVVLPQKFARVGLQAIQEPGRTNRIHAVSIHDGGGTRSRAKALDVAERRAKLPQLISRLRVQADHAFMRHGVRRFFIGISDFGFRFSDVIPSDFFVHGVQSVSNHDEGRKTTSDVFPPDGLRAAHRPGLAQTGFQGNAFAVDTSPLGPVGYRRDRLRVHSYALGCAGWQPDLRQLLQSLRIAAAALQVEVVVG